MLIEEREREFGVLLPWRDYFKRLKKKKFKKGKRGTKERESGNRKKGESRSSIEWMNLKFSRNSRSFFRSKHFNNNCPFSPPPPRKLSPSMIILLYENRTSASWKTEEEKKKRRKKEKRKRK